MNASLDSFIVEEPSYQYMDSEQPVCWGKRTQELIQVFLYHQNLGNYNLTHTIIFSLDFLFHLVCVFFLKCIFHKFPRQRSVFQEPGPPYSQIHPQATFLLVSGIGVCGTTAVFSQKESESGSGRQSAPLSQLFLCAHHCLSSSLLGPPLPLPLDSSSTSAITHASFTVP